MDEVASNGEQNETTKTETAVEDLDEATCGNVNAPLQLQTQLKDIPEDQDVGTEEENEKRDEEKPILTSFNKKRRSPTKAGSNPGQSRNSLPVRPVVRFRKRRISLRRALLETLFLKKKISLGYQSLYEMISQQAESQDQQEIGSEETASDETSWYLEPAIELQPQLNDVCNDSYEDQHERKNGKNDQHKKCSSKDKNEKFVQTSFKQKRRRKTSKGLYPVNSPNSLQSRKAKELTRKRIKSLKRTAIATLIERRLLTERMRLQLSDKSWKPQTESLDPEVSKSRMAENETEIRYFGNYPSSQSRFQFSSSVEDSPPKETKSSSSACLISNERVAKSQLQTNSNLESSSSSCKHQPYFQNFRGNNPKIVGQGTSDKRFATEPSSMANFVFNSNRPSLLQDMVTNKVFHPSSTYPPLISYPKIVECRSLANRRMESPYKGCKPKLIQGLQGEKSRMPGGKMKLGGFATKSSFASKSQVRPYDPSPSQEMGRNKIGLLSSKRTIYKAITPKPELQRENYSEEILACTKKINFLLNQSKTNAVNRENKETSESKIPGSKAPLYQSPPSCSTKSTSPPLMSKEVYAKSQQPRFNMGGPGFEYFVKRVDILQNSEEAQGINRETSENQTRSSGDFTNSARQSTRRSLGSPVNTETHYVTTGQPDNAPNETLVASRADPTIWMTVVERYHSDTMVEIMKWKKVVNLAIRNGHHENGLYKMWQNISEVKFAKSMISHHLTLMCDHQTVFNKLMKKLSECTRFNLSSSRSFMDLPMSTERVKTFTSLFLYMYKSLFSEAPMKPFFIALDTGKCSSNYNSYTSRKEICENRLLFIYSLKRIAYFKYYLDKCSLRMKCEIPQPEHATLEDLQNHISDLKMALNRNIEGLKRLVFVGSYAALSVQVCQNESFLRTLIVLCFLTAGCCP